MWVASLEIQHECIILSKTKKFNLVDNTYLLSLYHKNKDIYYTNIHYLHGEPKQISQFILALKKDSQIKKVEAKGNIVYTLTKAKTLPVAYYFNKETFLTTPVIHHKNKEIWNVASWEKNELMDFIKKVQSLGKVKVLKICRTFIQDFFVQKALPKLTEKQRSALELAIKEGYYAIPKKIETDKLAKLMKLSRATYQEHLRKAEAKLLPFVLKSQH
ncbi:MAG: helix-turn-helix domain-containing protein [Candidatus Woesearchaeota archaeon]